MNRSREEDVFWILQYCRDGLLRHGSDKLISRDVNRVTLPDIADEY
jgi:hypothetical protein